MALNSSSYAAFVIALFLCQTFVPSRSGSTTARPDLCFAFAVSKEFALDCIMHDTLVNSTFTRGINPVPLNASPSGSAIGYIRQTATGVWFTVHSVDGAFPSSSADLAVYLPVLPARPKVQVVYIPSEASAPIFCFGFIFQSSSARAGRNKFQYQCRRLKLGSGSEIATDGFDLAVSNTNDLPVLLVSTLSFDRSLSKITIEYAWIDVFSSSTSITAVNQSNSIFTSNLLPWLNYDTVDMRISPRTHSIAIGFAQSVPKNSTEFFSIERYSVDLPSRTISRANIIFSAHQEPSNPLTGIQSYSMEYTDDLVCFSYLSNTSAISRPIAYYSSCISDTIEITIEAFAYTDPTFALLSAPLAVTVPNTITCLSGIRGGDFYHGCGASGAFNVNTAGITFSPSVTVPADTKHISSSATVDGTIYCVFLLVNTTSSKAVCRSTYDATSSGLVDVSPFTKPTFGYHTAYGGSDPSLFGFQVHSDLLFVQGDGPSDPFNTTYVFSQPNISSPGTFKSVTPSKAVSFPKMCFFSSSRSALIFDCIIEVPRRSDSAPIGYLSYMREPILQLFDNYSNGSYQSTIFYNSDNTMVIGAIIVNPDGNGPYVILVTHNFLTGQTKYSNVSVLSSLIPLKVLETIKLEIIQTNQTFPFAVFGIFYEESSPRKYYFVRLSELSGNYVTYLLQISDLSADVTDYSFAYEPNSLRLVTTWSNGVISYCNYPNFSEVGKGCSEATPETSTQNVTGFIISSPDKQSIAVLMTSRDPFLPLGPNAFSRIRISDYSGGFLSLNGTWPSDNVTFSSYNPIKVPENPLVGFSAKSPDVYSVFYSSAVSTVILGIYNDSSTIIGRPDLTSIQTVKLWESNGPMVFSCGEVSSISSGTTNGCNTRYFSDGGSSESRWTDSFLNNSKRSIELMNSLDLLTTCAIVINEGVTSIPSDCFCVLRRNASTSAIASQFPTAFNDLSLRFIDLTAKSFLSGSACILGISSDARPTSNAQIACSPIFSTPSTTLPIPGMSFLFSYKLNEFNNYTKETEARSFHNDFELVYIESAKYSFTLLGEVSSSPSTPPPILSPPTPTPTSNLVPPSPIPASPTSVACIGTQPQNSNCINGSWVVSSSLSLTAGEITWSNPVQVIGNLSLSSSVLSISNTLNVNGSFVVIGNTNLQIDAPVIISGNLVLQDSSVISLSSNSSQKLEIGGCLDLSQNSSILNVTVDATERPSSLTLASYSCVNGSFSSINAQVTGDDCLMADSDPNYLRSSLTVTFTYSLKPDSACIPGSITPTPSGLEIGAIAGIAAAGAAVVIIAIVVAVIFAIPSVRKRVLPYRDRKAFEPKS